MTFKFSLFSLLIFFIIQTASAQDSLLFAAHKNKIGFVSGRGFQYVGQLFGNDSHRIALATTYNYQVTFYELQIYHSLLRHKHFGIDLLIQPQYNTAKYKFYDDDSTAYIKAHEVGMNLGFLYRINTSRNMFSYYMSISTGPHYVSGTPHRQSPGFVFSNNLTAGVNVKLYRFLYADVRMGIRHISNLGFKIPNAGVNDLTLNEGLIAVF